MSVDTDGVLEAVLGSVDRGKLTRALARLAPAPAPVAAAPAAAPSTGSAKTADLVVRRIVLSDILDDSILGARPGETSFPLRTFFGTIGDELEDDLAFALASGINFFFRVAMDEEAKMVLGLEVSRLYYRFATERPLDAELVTALSPLLARLMSTELSNLAFESVDGARVFDSSVHERGLGSSGSSPKILGPKSFLCRVVSNGRVRNKAMVRT